MSGMDKISWNGFGVAVAAESLHANASAESVGI